MQRDSRAVMQNKISTEINRDIARFLLHKYDSYIKVMKKSQFTQVI